MKHKLKPILILLVSLSLLGAGYSYLAQQPELLKQFTDETGACLVISDTIYSMLLTHEKFQSFIPNAISTAHKETEVLIALSCDSREEVDSIVDKAIELGGTYVRDPQDHGFMYERAYRDLDGHIWEYYWMDPAVVEG